MGSFASITLNGLTINEWKNTWHRWYFRDSERVRNVDNSTGEFIFLGYKSTAGTIRKRLELDGFTFKQLENEFYEMRSNWIAMLEGYYDEDLHQNELSILKQNPNIKTWINLLSDAQRLNFSEPKNLNNDLLEFMLSDDFDEDPLYSGGGFHFPCKSTEAWAVAILSISSDDDIVELDLTDLANAGWIDDFHDIAEIQAGKTTFCNNFSNFIDELALLPVNFTEHHLMQRLAFSGVFSALEAYLSDTMKKQVMTRPAVKRRFVESHGKFSGMKKFTFDEIFIKLDELEQLIIDELDFISFHNMNTIPELFRKVLFVEFPKSSIPQLCEAVKKRHDIVHRNGKDTAGKIIHVTNDDVTELIGLTKDVVSEIDRQILDFQKHVED
ncbi:TPA: HEPN/Toprim-associated domain-containing protein [Kluyvera georgiana]